MEKKMAGKGKSWTAKKQAVIIAIIILALLLISVAFSIFSTPSTKSPTTTIGLGTNGPSSGGSTEGGPGNSSGLNATGGGTSGPGGGTTTIGSANTTGGLTGVNGINTGGSSGGNTGGNLGGTNMTGGNTGGTSGTSFSNCTAGGGGLGRTYLSDCEMESLFGAGGEYGLGVTTPSFITVGVVAPPEMCMPAFNDTNWHISNQSGVGTDAWGNGAERADWVITYDKCHGIGANCTCGNTVTESIGLFSNATAARDEYANGVRGMTTGQTGNMTTVVNATANGLLYSYFYTQYPNYRNLFMFLLKDKEVGTLEAGINNNVSIPSIAAEISADMPP